MREYSKFWDRIANNYSKQPIENEEAYAYKLEKTRAVLTPETEVLELGCGTGNTAVFHAPLVKHIHAVDFSQSMLEIAKTNALGVPNISFEQASAEDYDAKGKVYDVVLTLSILHLLADPQAAISRVFGMVKPGGHFISSTVCVGETLKFMKLFAPLGRRLGLLPMLRVFTVAELVEMITAAGFEVEHQWQPGKGKAVFIMARKPA